MADPSLLQALNISGFRAFLQPKTLDFSDKRYLAVFAPNGYGKSSIIDALEFMLSEHGTLARLGQRAVNNQAGPAALAHNLAKEEEISPSVTISVLSGKDSTKGSRATSGAQRPMPAVAEMLNTYFEVSPIIRGHELRTFVEAQTPEARYADVANWLQLGPLVTVQKNIRALRTQVKTASEDKRALRRVDTQLAQETNQIVRTWEEAEILTYVNDSVLAPLDSTMTLMALSAVDPAYVALQKRAEEEATKIGLATLRHNRIAAADLRVETTNTETGKVEISGAIPAFETALATLSSAITKEEEERRKSERAAFQTLWKQAEPFFAEGADALDVCPVCATPIANTIAGSTEAIRNHISQHLEELTDYATAKQALDGAVTAASRTKIDLTSALTGLIRFLDDESTLIADLITYRESLKNCSRTNPPNSTDIVAAIAEHLIALDEDIATIEARQGEHTYGKAKTKIDRLLDLNDERNLTLVTKDQLVELSEALTEQGKEISARIREKLQTLLDKLQAPMNKIYGVIQGPNATTIHLRLPPEVDANQQRLNLLIDFAENRSDVQPSGYLSDSQIHSVALALRMAAIKQFNARAPVMALDDIVTSYDADHRRTIAGLIATMFPDWQMLLTTHDERFFNYLKDQLEAKTWRFSRIIGLDPTYGPRFADHKVSDEMIERRWADGESAANDMRQAEEEWLLGICRDFGVNVRIRPLEKAYSYERSELAFALAAFLKSRKLEPEDVPGVNNRFVTSLAKGEIENFGSHFQDAPYGKGSIGDEKVRWQEFKAFRGQFVCRVCKRNRFQRPVTLNKPVCAHTGCETQFAFAV